MKSQELLIILLRDVQEFSNYELFQICLFRFFRLSVNFLNPTTPTTTQLHNNSNSHSHRHSMTDLQSPTWKSLLCFRVKVDRVKNVKALWGKLSLQTWICPNLDFIQINIWLIKAWFIDFIRVLKALVLEQELLFLGGLKTLRVKLN